MHTESAFELDAGQINLGKEDEKTDLKLWQSKFYKEKKV